MSNNKLAKQNGINIRTAYRIKKRLGLTFAETIELMKIVKRPLNKHIDGLSVKEYCSKYGYKHEKEFYRHWHILQEGR